MEDPKKAPPRSPWLRLLALLAALLVIGGSIFYAFTPRPQADAAPHGGAFPLLPGASARAEGFTPLKKGDGGQDVRKMQEALFVLGYYDGPISGNFSKVFEAAVIAFQKDFSLEETGRIDADTYDLLLLEAAGGQTAAPAPGETAENAVVRGESYSDREHVAAYLREFGELPGNYITKKEAQALGWASSEGNLWKVAPGKSIGGDYFGNYEGLLPRKKGREYTECDIDFDGGYRNGKRIIFSNDGLIFYTDDHYQTFEEIKK